VIQTTFAEHVRRWWGDNPFAAVKARVREEAPHERFRVLGDWSSFGALIADSKYTDLLFPDHNLDLQHCGINLQTVDVLRDALLRNSSITSLNMNDNTLGKFGAAAMAEVLRASTTLTHVNFSNNLLKDDGVEKLLEGLVHNRSVTHLFLRVNRIGAAGAALLAQWLASNTTAVDVNLDGNDIGPEGAKAFAAHLTTNATLQSLNLMYNDIGDAGGAALAGLLHKNHVIELGLKGNNISRATQALFPDH